MSVRQLLVLGASALTSASVAQRIDDKVEGRGGLAPARVEEVIAGMLMSG